MLFLSWPVTPGTIAGRIPPQLSLDTFDGQAWITLIPFRMERLRLRGLPPIPPFSQFDEVDCLTYVAHREARGIWFFRIEADTRLGSAMAGMLFGLPYHSATISLDVEGEERTFRCEGEVNRAGERPELRLRYRPRGPIHEAAPGTLAHLIVEQFVMFSRTRSGTLLSGRESRAPRRIQECDVVVSRNTLAEAARVPGPTGEPVAWYCARSDIRTWLPAPVAEPVTSGAR
jgi:uncharacterized protein YqjF (DUF2071 family)